ncbi:MAG: HAMP domain-containing histidine kinase [Chloroflexi bacterium]|nr:MAG: HAMP domain-containing histidine kinase [Chloroflexota bacterium]
MSGSGWRGRGWGPPGGRGRGQPPWWPQGEPWPPTRRPPWGRIGRRFMWRFAGFIAAAFLLLAVALTVGALLVGTAVGLLHAPHLVRFVAIAALILFVILIIRASRQFRGMAVNLGDIVDAAGRIEAGDYGVQVAERGPRELRTLARAFNAMSVRLAAADRNRRAVVADLTHELRTPLAIIRGQAEGIGDGVYPGDQAHVTPILDAAATLETLVDALGTMTLADVGGLKLNREAVDVPVLVTSSLAAFQSAADAAGVRLIADVGPDLPAVDADPARIRGVLGNLLSNAIRYTPSGGTVTASVRRSGSSVAFAVRDTGPGIPAELRPQIFERFVKGPGSPGSGLGLAIAKDVVSAHGGTIEATSEPGQGTEVRFTLPVVQ